MDTCIESNNEVARLVSRSAGDPWSVSVIIPCRNEVKFIGACLDSLIANGYPHDRLEILVIDGISSDGTREIVHWYASRYQFIHLLNNPRGITPCALNIGIAKSHNDVVMRVDAHATYEPGYIEYCIDALQRYGVEDSGGSWRIVPRANGILSRAIVQVMAHRFGGAARYRRTGDAEPQIVDLVPFFCCRRETLIRAGKFNEHLIRHQDYEYNVKLKRMGARFMLVPRAVCNYYARTDLRSFYLHSFRDGIWVILASAYSDVLTFSARHLAPLVFVFAVVTGCIASLFSTLAGHALALMLATYLSAALFSSAQIAVREGSTGLFFVTLPMFAVRHISFGLGSLVGVVQAAASAMRRQSGRG